MTDKFYSQLYEYFKNLTPKNIRIADCVFYTGNTSNTKRHCHDTLELDYFLKGKHSIYTNTSITPIISHAYNIIGYMPQCIHQGSLLGAQETIVLWLDIPSCPSDLASHFWLSDKSGTLRWLFEQIYAEYNANHPERDALIESYAYCIIKHIMRHFLLPSNSGIKDDILELLQYINSNYSSDISPEQMACKLNISKSHLHKVFKDFVGITPLQYVQNVRIEQAKAILASSRYSIQEVSDLVGYHDTRYFSRIFKQLTGMSPRDWKKINPSS